MIIFYISSDFDVKLIEQVDSGVPAEKIISEIEEESSKQELTVKNHLQAHMMDMKYWNRVNSDPKNDLEYHITIYQKQMEIITEYKELRIQFVKGQITKNEFLEKMKPLKTKLEI